MIERGPNIEFHDEWVIDAGGYVSCQVEFKKHGKEDGQKKSGIDDQQAVPLRE
jgi:hypothetical protein